MPPKPLPLEASMRQTIAAHLPDAFKAAIQSYNAFYGQPAPDDPKSFAAHHGACKAAIAHLQLLIKLAGWVESDVADDDAERLNETRALAQEELEKFGALDDV